MAISKKFIIKDITVRKLILTLLGLVLISALAFSCFKDKSETIKERLISNTKSALEQKGFKWADVNLKGDGLKLTNIISLTGVAPSDEAKTEAGKVAFRVVGVGGVDNQLQVSSTENISEVNEKSQVENDSSEPQANETLPDIKAVDVVQKESAEEKTQNSIEEESAKQKAKNTYTIIAKKDQNGVLIEGYVPSKELHDRLISELSAEFGKENISDNLKIKADAPKDWQYISEFLVKKLTTVDYGDLNITGNSYVFNAHLPTYEKKVEFLNGIKEIMSNADNHFGRYRGDYVITAPIADAQTTKKEEASKAQKNADCQESLDSVIGDKKVYFDYDKSTIKSTSYPLLDSIVATLQTCDFDGKHLEVGGYTDSIGRASYNKKLSQRRAQSVVIYLANKGVKSSNMVAIGYGESSPIASNKTKDGRAKNRRIEFKIK